MSAAIWNGNSIRISDRFYDGGDTFRGFQIAGIGPRDLQYGDALGGKLHAIGTMEMTLPTKLPEQYGIKAALFTDFGTLGLLDKKDTINPDTNQPIIKAFLNPLVGWIWAGLAVLVFGTLFALVPSLSPATASLRVPEPSVAPAA